MGEVVVGGLLALGGVVVASLLNVFVDRARWRRDWLVSQVNRRLDHYTELVEALYAQHVLIAKAADGVTIAPAQVDRAITDWRIQLARTLILAPAAVQHAVRGYDETQAAVAVALNAGDRSAVVGALPALDAARLGVLAEIEKDQHDINSALAQHLLSPWRRLRLRGGQPWTEDAEGPPPGGLGGQPRG